MRAVRARPLTHGHESRPAGDGSDGRARPAGARGGTLLSSCSPTSGTPIMDGIALALAAARDFPQLTIC